MSYLASGGWCLKGRETERWGRREGELYGNILLFLLGNIYYFNKSYDKI